MQVVGQLCDKLAPRLDKQMDIPRRRQVVLELLGRDFTSQYLNSTESSSSPAPYSPHLLENISDGERAKLQTDGRNWLEHALNKTANETGYQRPIAAETAG